MASEKGVESRNLRENSALSLGERVSRNGVFSSRRGTGEGSFPATTGGAYIKGNVGATRDFQTASLGKSKTMRLR